jgi:hypothetical protein
MDDKDTAALCNEVDQQLSHAEPAVELFLSRGAYRSGDTVCGTVRLFLQHREAVAAENPDTKNSNALCGTAIEEQARLRKIFTHASIHLSGKCRVDARWHPAAATSGVLQDLYGSVHPILVNDLPPETIRAEANSDLDDLGMLSKANSTVVYFFATNCASLLDLPERGEPCHRKSLRISWSDINDEEDDVEGGSDIHHSDHESQQPYASPSSTYAEKCRHLAFTFQAPLPEDLPPTTYATCCRYFYSAVVSVRTIQNQVLTAQVPFTLLSCARMRFSANRDLSLTHTSHLSMVDKRSKTRVQVGLCSAKAHSNSLSCHVSPSTYARKPQIGVSSTGLCSTMTIRDTRYLRMTNTDGIPACLLKAVGSRVMLPGGRMLLQFDFNPDELLLLTNGHNNEPSLSSSPSVLKCLQIGACLRGEEVACHGTTRVVTRTYVLDTGHAYVDSDVDSISMTLGLPLDSPCSLSTELVEISIVCRIELTVETDRIGASGRHSYEVLTLELPVEVVETKIFQEEEENYTGEMNLLGTPRPSFYENEDSVNQIPQDILNDLTMLSIRMLDAVEVDS